MTIDPAPFDPYRDWLNIQTSGEHFAMPDHYQLLGLPRFEGDATRIAAAADERMALVRSFQVGPRRAFTQKLLNELSAARVCLLSATAKAAYDARLHAAGVSPGVPSGTTFPPARYLPSPIDAPPILPPPPPLPPLPAPSVTIANDREPLDPASISAPAPWWRPLASMLAAAVFLLAAAMGWSLFQANRPPTPGPTTDLPISSIPHEPEVEPEPLPPEPIVQLQEGSGEVHLSPATAVLQQGIELRPAGTQEVLAGFTSPGAAALWQFRLIEPGFFELELQYATAVEVESVALVAEFDNDSKSLDLRPTGSLDQFHTDTFTIAIPNSGRHTFRLHASTAFAGEGLILKSVRLIPVGTTDVGERGASAP